MQFSCGVDLHLCWMVQDYGKDKIPAEQLKHLHVSQWNQFLCKVLKIWISKIMYTQYAEVEAIWYLLYAIYYLIAEVTLVMQISTTL